MDQLHLPPDLYKEVRDRANFAVSAWLHLLAELRTKYLKSSLGAAVRSPHRTGRKR
jgi:hypothetical protein